MTRFLTALVLALGMTVAAARAASYPLVGHWLTTSMDPRGVTNSLLDVTFTSDGRLIVIGAVSGSGGSGRLSSTASYRLTGKSSYAGRVTDYEPKDIPPLLGGPIGTKFNCTFAFESYSVVDITCGSNKARYTRQP